MVYTFRNMEYRPPLRTGFLGPEVISCSQNPVMLSKTAFLGKKDHDTRPLQPTKDRGLYLASQASVCYYYQRPLVPTGAGDHHRHLHKATTQASFVKTGGNQVSN